MGKFPAAFGKTKPKKKGKGKKGLPPAFLAQGKTKGKAKKKGK